MALSPHRRAERARDWECRSAPPRIAGESVIVDGFGVDVRVQHGQLVITDGAGRERRQRRYGRATSNIARLVSLGGTGSLSLEAIRWLTNIGAGIICIDRDGRILLTSAPTSSEARLRRAQALAAFNDTGLQITKALLGAKVAGQLRVADELDAASVALDAIRQAAAAIDGATTIDEMVRAEADAAVAYWGSWANVELPFHRRDHARIPQAWLRFGQRHSRLATGPRMASRPGNAILNYLYALLEAEARLACLTIGLDPALAIVHADSRGRDSLPLDLMEAVRPDVDRYLLGLLRGRVFRPGDFYETQRGNCRVLPPLSHELAETLPAWRNLIAPVTEQVARLLTRGETAKNTVPTRLTRHAHRAANARRQGRSVPAEIPPAPKPERRCKRCGGRLPNQRRVYCDACLPHVQRDRHDALIAAGQSALRRKLNSPADTSHRGDAAVKRADALRRRTQELREWSAAHPNENSDPAVFDREILPLIQPLSLNELARATGLGKTYLAEVRRGVRVPHQRHWAALRAAAEVDHDCEALRWARAQVASRGHGASGIVQNEQEG